MLRALLIGSLLVVPAKIASACDEDSTEDADNDDETADADAPDVASIDNALEARVEALEERVAAMDRSCDDASDDGDDVDVEGAIEID